MLLGVSLSLAWASSGQLLAAELYQGDGLDLRWDNTFRYSAGFRVESRDADLIDNANTDDGDRDFRPGVISNRMDVLSELDLTAGDFGLRVSADGWYDTIYHQRDDNDSPATFNPLSVPHDQFPRDVRDLEGSSADLLDAFFHGSFQMGGMPVSFRIGRHTLLWGESLFFAGNGIAAGQAPIDAIKASSQPSAQAKEIFLPVTQASAVLFPAPDVSLSLYYQFEWRKDRFPGVGSYFSAVDFLDDGGERLFLSPGSYLLRSPKLDAPSSGQFGAALQVTSADFSYGFYALRFNSKDPQIYLRPDGSPSGDAGTYQLVYPTGIEVYGASISSYLWDANIAGEISTRRNMPLISGGIVVPAGIDADASHHPLYAIGDTLHAQVSAVDIFPANRLWDGASFAAELAANDLLSVTRNASALDPSRDRFATAIRTTFTPTYFQILPNLDVGVPLGVGYGLTGRSSTDQSENARAGDMELGISATYLAVWQANLTFTHFFGPHAIQPFADRDFVSFSVQRTF